ncbi:MAG: AzlC family ABC transporter permease [Minwuia sp.]|uniref:AzlC family ABC transporter permease n=1 Tax=Minwuia sp. TaxID=2493630 RepID=UPI003A8C7212
MSLLNSMQQGARATAGFTIGSSMFGIVFGSAAIATGLTEAQAVIMSATAFAGAAQFASLAVWDHPMPWLAVAITVALVSTRNVLMGLSLSSDFGKAPWPFRLIIIHMLVDASWAMSMRHRGRSDMAAFYFGSAASLYVTWMVGVAIGVLLPDAMDAVTMAAIGFGGVLFLSLVLVMLARARMGPRLPWAVSAVVAISLSFVASPEVVLLGAVGSGASFALLFDGRRA